MSQVFYPILFVLGTAVGSFLNVVIWRYNPEGSVFDFKALSGRSHCPYCGKQLQWFELIPLVSFLIQGGKCRGCAHKLSLQYPVVELLSGLITVFVPFYLNRFYGVSLDFLALSQNQAWYYGLVVSWILVFLVWLLITFIDLKHYLIPDELNLAILVLGMVITAILYTNQELLSGFRSSFLKHYVLIFSPTESFLVNRAFGIAAGTLFFGALSFFGRGRAMGMGDVKLAFVSALALGWPDIALVIALSFVFGGLWGVGLILFKQKTMHSRVPFAPFFVLGAATTFFFGYHLVKGYFLLFNL